MGYLSIVCHHQVLLEDHYSREVTLNKDFFDEKINELLPGQCLNVLRTGSSYEIWISDL